MSETVNQKYNLDLSVKFNHAYDRLVKAESAPATSGNSQFEMRRVERIEHLNFQQCAEFMLRLNELIDELEAKVEH